MHHGGQGGHWSLATQGVQGWTSPGGKYTSTLPIGSNGPWHIYSVCSWMHPRCRHINTPIRTLKAHQLATPPVIAYMIAPKSSLVVLPAHCI